MFSKIFFISIAIVLFHHECFSAENISDSEKQLFTNTFQKQFDKICDVSFSETLSVANTIHINRDVIFSNSEKKLLIKQQIPSSATETTDLRIPEKYFTLSKETTDNHSEYVCSSRIKYPQTMWQNEMGKYYFFHFSGLLSDDIDTFIKIVDFVSNKDTLWKGDVINGKNCFLLSGKVGGVDVKIWIDCEKHFIWQILLLRGENNSVSTQYSSRQYIVNNVQMIGDIIVPQSMSVVEKFPSGQTQPPPEIKEQVIKQIKEHGGTLVLPERKMSTQIVFKDISLKAKISEDKLFSKTNIPNGTPVIMLDAPQIQYVWMDGEIVPKTDEVALRILQGDHKFIPGPKESRFWFMALGLILFFLGGGLKLYSMLKENNKKEKEEKEEQ
jgi:hypothetical protein